MLAQAAEHEQLPYHIHYGAKAAYVDTFMENVAWAAAGRPQPALPVARPERSAR